MGSRFGPQSTSIGLALGFFLISGMVSTGCVNRTGQELDPGLMSFPIAIELSPDLDAEGLPKQRWHFLNRERQITGQRSDLDPDYDLGAAHSVMIVLEALPEAMGGSRERARDHFEQAVALSQGLSAGPYVTLAQQVSVPAQDWREFERLLQQALEIDPDREPSLRLVNIITQQRARTLLGEIEELFLDYPEESTEEDQ